MPSAARPLECTGGTVHFHGAQLDLAVYFLPGGEKLEIAAGPSRSMIRPSSLRLCIGASGPPAVDVGRSGFGAARFRDAHHRVQLGRGGVDPENLASDRLRSR